MCGLFGIYSKFLTNSEKDMFVELGQMSSLRGIDSTGLVIGNRKKKWGEKYRINLKKAVMNPVSFLNEQEVRADMNVDNVFLLMGHCRAATVGHINYQNAHPIQHENITLCHNGTIKEWAPSKELEAHTSDSRIFAEKISGSGAVSAFEQAEVGAYAVTFVDTKKKTLYMARNSGRTLFTVFSNDDEVMMWASEDMFLETVLRRNGVRHNYGRIQIVPLHTMYEWHFTQKPGDGHFTEYKAKEVIDVSKYATRVPSDNAKYEEWLKQNSRFGAAHREIDTYGDPAFEPEEDPPEPLEAAAQGVREAIDEVRQIAFQGPTLPSKDPAGGTIDSKDFAARFSGAYCFKCTEALSVCQCASAGIYFPLPYELDSQGRWKPEEAAKISGTTALGAPAGSLVSHHSRDTSNDTYIGYSKQPMDPSIATEKLKTGCAICGHQSSMYDTVFWYDDYGHLCEDHGRDTNFHQAFIGTVSTFKSRYIKGDMSNAIH